MLLWVRTTTKVISYQICDDNSLVYLSVGARRPVAKVIIIPTHSTSSFLLHSQSIIQSSGGQLIELIMNDKKIYICNFSWDYY